MQKPEKLDIGLPGPASSITKIRGEGDTFAVLAAGFGYTIDMPLFYYLSRHFMERNTGLVLIDLGYSRDSGFLSLAEEEMDRRFESDIAILAGWLESSTTGNLLLAGKSLGSTVCLRLVQNRALAGRIRKAAWLTPGTSSEEIYSSLPGNRIANLVVYGTADRYTKQESVDAAAAAPNVDVLAVDNGDHSLETGTVPGSLEVLRTVLDRLDAFFS